MRALPKEWGLGWTGPLSSTLRRARKPDDETPATTLCLWHAHVDILVIAQTLQFARDAPQIPVFRDADAAAASTSRGACDPALEQTLICTSTQASAQQRPRHLNHLARLSPVSCHAASSASAASSIARSWRSSSPSSAAASRRSSRWFARPSTAKFRRSSACSRQPSLLSETCRLTLLIECSPCRYPQGKIPKKGRHQRSLCPGCWQGIRVIRWPCHRWRPSSPRPCSRAACSFSKSSPKQQRSQRRTPRCTPSRLGTAAGRPVCWRHTEAKEARRKYRYGSWLSALLLGFGEGAISFCAPCTDLCRAETAG